VVVAAAPGGLSVVNPRTTGILLLAALGLGAFVYWYEIRGEDARLESVERAKRLFQGIEAGDIAWIALRTTEGVDARVEQREGRWELTQPLAFPADAAVNRMAETLASVTSEAAFDHPQPDAEYGLDDDSARIVRFGVGEAERVLRLGKKTPVGSNIYARSSDSPSVYTVAGYHATAFERTLTDLRDKRILDVDTSAIREIEARWPGGRVVLTRGAAEGAPADAAGEWRLTAPLAARADAEAVDRLLSTLSFLRADGFVDAPTPAQLRLLDPPDFEVSLRSGDAAVAPVVLSIGRANDAKRRWVRAGRDVLYEIPAERLADFPREAVAYRYRQLASFAATEAQQIDFFFRAGQGDPVAIRAERSGEGWSSSPESFRPGLVAQVASELSRLTAAEILAESMGEAELEALGLSPPDAILTVFGKTPEAAADADAKADDAGEEPAESGEPPAPPRLAEVHFGHVTPQGVVARAAGETTIYRLAPQSAEQLPVNLEVYRERFRAEPEQPAEPPPEDLQVPPGAREDLDVPAPTEESP
jgi:uncharacterized protein DUF4340